MLFLVSGCKTKDLKMNTVQKCQFLQKEVVYQVLLIIWKQNTTNKPWGTLEENGVGKFNDFTPKALQE
jgi:hypothetical protein